MCSRNYPITQPTTSTNCCLGAGKPLNRRWLNQRPRPSPPERAAVLPHHPAAQSGSIRPCFRQTLYRCAQRPTNGTNKVEFWLPRRHINRERRLLLKKGLQIGLRLDDPIKNFATRVLPEISYPLERCARRLCRNHEPCGGLWGMARATRRSRVILRSGGALRDSSALLKTPNSSILAPEPKAIRGIPSKRAGRMEHDGG